MGHARRSAALPDRPCQTVKVLAMMIQLALAIGAPAAAPAAGSPTTATAPAAFGPAQFDVAPITGDATHLGVTLNALPADGGQAITAVFAEVDSGSGYGAPIQLGGRATGVVYPVPVLAGVPASVRIWAENGILPVNRSPVRTATPWIAAGSAWAAAIGDFSRDRTIFDSGAALGQNAAHVPLSGTTDAPDGEVIEARAVSLDDGGASSTAWQDVGPAAGGAWSGTLDAPRNASWYAAEARVKGSSAAAVRTANRFGAGHIIMVLGQSEDARMFDPGFDYRGQPGATVTVPTLTDEDAVQVVFQVEGGASSPYPTQGPVRVTSTTPVTPSVAHMADVLTRNTNEKWLIVDAAHSGTSPDELANDSVTTRNWSDLVNILTVARADGADVGLVMDSWTAAPSASGDNWRLKYYPFYLGVFANGTDYTLGTQHPGFAVTYDHCLFDLSSVGGRGLFDTARTRIAYHGPHRFEDGVSDQNPFTDPSGSYASGYVSSVLNAANLTSVPRLHVTAGGGAVTVEGSNDQSSWTAVYSGTPSEYADLAAPKYTYYRITTTTGGRFFLTNGFALLTVKEDTRRSIRNLVDDTLAAPAVLTKGPEMLLYQNGFPATVADTAGGGISNHNAAGPYWLDGAHPSAFTNDGLPARARHAAVAALYGLGLVPHHVPHFNRVAADPAGAWVELWYEAPDGSTPPITTTRLKRGLPALTQNRPHRTEVWGFWINSEVAQHASIVNGRVRILPNSGAFTGADAIRYGIGGASGIQIWPEDELLGGWMNLPMADMGIAGIEGVALEPLPDPNEIAIPLAAAPTFTTSAAGPYYVAPGNIPAGTSRIVFAAKIKPAVGAPDGALWQLSGNNAFLTRYADGSLRTVLVDSAGTTLISPEFLDGRSSLVPGGTASTVVFAIDLAARTVNAWINGALRYSKALPANSGQLSTVRKVALLALTNGATQFQGSAEYVRMWLNQTTTDGSEPAATPYVDVSAPAAVANAHPWKAGADAT